MHWPRIRGLCSVSWCLAEGQWNRDQRRPMGHKAQEGLYSLPVTKSGGGLRSPKTLTLKSEGGGGLEPSSLIEVYVYGDVS